MREWKEKLQKKLNEKFGAKKAKQLSTKYLHAFPSNYCEGCSFDDALSDIQQFERLSPDNPLDIVFYHAPDQDKALIHLRLYQYGSPIPLSDILPIFENLDLRTYDERPYEIRLNEKNSLWISDFSVSYTKNPNLDLNKLKDNFDDAFTHIRFGLCENDGFNKLILGAELTWREVSILRAYAKYLHQTGFRASQIYIELTAAKYPGIIKNLIALFKAKFTPTKKASTNQIEDLEDEIKKNLENISSLEEDKILRNLWHLIKATIRTNYFQHNKDKTFKEYISFKLRSDEVLELPLPRPLYEIWVYSPRFEGIHLRAAKVARGGIRWSDRRDDFRTEVLGLMKAQKVKNSVIVPSGAKGGFVLKALPPDADRALMQTEVVNCYKEFIRGLLDLTDNLKKDKVIRPDSVICFDDEDPYLVVAADKGTATFSDIANSISNEYDFWLGDAFASGGSTGYDHKKIGITARGAWESIKRHFAELNIDYKTQDFTVIGIGDMSGDVFGNGMIYSRHIKLVAAFDHRHIFLDPNPNPEKSFDERLRLFNLPLSSWEDYNPKLISSGGGVFKRSAKSIALSPQVKALLNIIDDSLAPNELIRAILKAPVDLLYNGGIGTYVKSSLESHESVGDRANEFCRINGSELRVKAVGEGGNLGFTQLGRIEYALTGGIINTDFIDNSGGVDCSDHEVNIKILLDDVVKKKILSEKQRNQLLAKMTDEIAKLVLNDNYNQALVLSFSAQRAEHYASLFQNYIKELDTTHILNRVVEFLPDEKKLFERKAAKQGLTRPELAILLSYTKIYLKHEILKSDLPEDPYFNYMLERAFPAVLTKLYPQAMKKHRLRREIIATQLSSEVVNVMGITFVYRLQSEANMSVPDIVRAYIVTSTAFKTQTLQTLIDSLTFKIPLQKQYELLHHIRQLLNLASRWFLRNKRLDGDISTIIAHYGDAIDKLEGSVASLMSGATKNYMESVIQQFIEFGIPETVARRIAICRAMYTALNIIEVATDNKLDLIKTAQVYFDVGAEFNLVWFRDQISNDSREGYWNTLARLTIRDELDSLQRRLSISILQQEQKTKPSAKNASIWNINYQTISARWEKLLGVLHSSSNLDYSMFFIALRELSSLTQDLESL